MRIFVAIDIPEEIRRNIAELLGELKPATTKVRWARPEGMHITLKFIGEISPEQVEAVQQRLASLRCFSPIPIAIRGAGYFPNERSPRVIWLGIEAGADLAELAAETEIALAELGIPKEKRAFSAHLTLGRLQVPGKIPALQALLREHDPLDFGSFTAEEFVLYQSKLSAKGSEYRKLSRFPLAVKAE